jgi:toxin HigB-1
MIRRFAHSGTEDIFDGKNSREARRACPRSLWVVAARKLDQLDSVGALEDLKVPPGNRLELLKGNRKGQFSIRINRQYRICFAWKDDSPTDVEIVDYHD